MYAASAKPKKSHVQYASLHIGIYTFEKIPSDLKDLMCTVWRSESMQWNRNLMHDSHLRIHRRHLVPYRGHLFVKISKNAIGCKIGKLWFVQLTQLIAAIVSDCKKSSFVWFSCCKESWEYSSARISMNLSNVRDFQPFFNVPAKTLPIFL